MARRSMNLNACALLRSTPPPSAGYARLGDRSGGTGCRGQWGPKAKGRDPLRPPVPGLLACGGSPLAYVRDLRPLTAAPLAEPRNLAPQAGSSDPSASLRIPGGVVLGAAFAGGGPASRSPFPRDPGIRGPPHPPRLRCPPSPYRSGYASDGRLAGCGASSLSVHGLFRERPPGNRAEMDFPRGLIGEFRGLGWVPDGSGFAGAPLRECGAGRVHVHGALRREGAADGGRRER